MPQLCPPDPSFPDDGGAERALWDALREGLPDEAILFAGVHLLVEDAEHEIDAVVAWPGVGLAAVEVKGGHVTREAGAWYQGSGDKRHRIDPVAQVQSARHALQDLLRRHGSPAAPARIAHLVALPHTYVSEHVETADLPRGTLLDRGDLDKGPIAVVGKVKAAIERHGQGRAPLTEDGAQALVDFLGGSLTGQAEQLTAAAEHETRLEQMTRDQSTILDLVRGWRRASVVGGAGTGKTWLALEQARRRARAGDRVALLCYSRGLGRYFERMTSTWPAHERPAFVGLFHDLPLEWGAEPGPENDSDYWERRLPLRLGELAAQRAPDELFDCAVVDEAQDFGDLWWVSLLRCLREPDRGGLFVFMDEAQRVFSRTGHVPIDAEPLQLRSNLRSTKQIAQVFGSLAQDELTPRGRSGPPVRLVDVPAEDAISAADDAVEALLEEGWRPGQVALVTTHHRHPEQVNAVDVGGFAAYWDDFFAEQDVFYGHVLNFKGLERTVVVLAVDGFRESERARRMLYTGMSRARSLLVVVGPRDRIEEVGGAGVRQRLRKAQVWAPG